MTHAVPNRENFGVHARYTCVAAFAVIKEGEMPDGEHKYRPANGTVMWVIAVRLVVTGSGPDDVKASFVSRHQVCDPHMEVWSYCQR